MYTYVERRMKLRRDKTYTNISEQVLWTIYTAIAVETAQHTEYYQNKYLISTSLWHFFFFLVFIFIPFL